MIILSQEVKQEIINRLKSIDLNSDLMKILTEAALQGHRFPDEFGDEFLSLQNAYLQNKKNTAVKVCLQEAISIYFKTKGLQCFKSVLESEFDEKQWSSYLLFILIIGLKLDKNLKINPVVECTIHGSKIFWRIKDAENNILYQRHDDEYFENAKTWIMTWESFRNFKDSGKRSGTVEITQDRFVDYFPKESRPQARVVWDELKTMGILNNRNRLSDGWRVLVGKNLFLKSISHSECVIVKKDLIAALKPFKNKELTKEMLTDWTQENWGGKFIYRMELVWDQLKKNGDIDDNDKLVVNNSEHNLGHIQIAELLKSFEITYSDVTEALIEISNYEEYAESIIEKDNFFVYRPEINRKSWCNGSVENFDPKGDKYSNELWHVSTYYDLYLHRHSDSESEKYNQILNYDHIPSRFALSDMVNNRVKTLSEEKDNEVALLKQIHEQIKARGGELLKGKGPLSRNKLRTDGKILELEEEKERMQKKIKSINSQIETLENENRKDGSLWWAIAIPENLHQAGETYMKSGKKQELEGNIFLQNVMAYFEFLEKNAEKYSLNFIDDYLKALGGFRYLYHQQCKKPEKTCGQYRTGTIGQAFFTPEYKDEIDGFFTRKMDHFLSVKEGITNFVL